MPLLPLPSAFILLRKRLLFRLIVVCLFHPGGRGSCDDLLYFCPYFRPLSRLIVAFINTFPPLIARIISRLIVVLIRHVICASLVPALPFIGDYLLRAIVRSHVQGLCVGCAKDVSTIKDANNADGSEDVREDIGVDWLAQWRRRPPWLFRLRWWLVESGNSSGERSR